MSQQLTRRLRSADPADIDAWFTRIYPELEQLIVTGQRAANAATAQYLGNHAAAEGVLVRPALVDGSTEQIATSLRVTGPVAFKTSIAQTGSELAARRVMVKVSTGAAQRLLLTPPRESVIETVRQSTRIVGYRRVSDGNPCAFCAMLLSRGAVYKDSSTAELVGFSGRIRGTQEAGDAFHDHCHCGSEPVYSHDNGPPRFYAEWQQAKQIASEQGIRSDVAFRRLVEGRSLPTP